MKNFECYTTASQLSVICSVKTKDCLKLVSQTSSTPSAPILIGGRGSVRVKPSLMFAYKRIILRQERIFTRWMLLRWWFFGATKFYSSILILTKILNLI